MLVFVPKITLVGVTGMKFVQLVCSMMHSSKRHAGCDKQRGSLVCIMSFQILSYISRQVPLIRAADDDWRQSMGVLGGQRENDPR